MKSSDRKVEHNIFAHSRFAPRLLPLYYLIGLFDYRQKKPLKHNALPFTMLIFFLYLLLIPAYALDVPKLQGYVNDYANMISPQAKAELENELKKFEQTDSTQIVILTISSLEGEPLEDFSIRVADAWKIGQQGKDNGVIFFVSKEDRKIRIEVGRGLEGRLTDLTAGRIVDLVVKPWFKKGDFDGGFIAGVSSIIDATRGEFNADNRRTAKYDNTSRFMTFLIFGGIVMLFLGSMSRILGGISGAVGLPLLVNFLFSPLGIASAIIIGVLGLVLGLLLPVLFSSSGRYGGGSFWTGGGYYGGIGGFGGGSFGGGGFSGGGGGFGGGGASGGW